MSSPYQTEQWTEYGIGMVIFTLRFFARWKVVGIANFAWDDFFAFIAMMLWTVDSATVQIISQYPKYVNEFSANQIPDDYGSFVGLNEQTAAALSDETAARYEVGSKALFIAWISYVTLIWSLKGSLLFFYSRLTSVPFSAQLLLLTRILASDFGNKNSSRSWAFSAQLLMLQYS